MGLTTIKVDTTVRDRLAKVAKARGTTMGALLEAESQRLNNEQRWIEIRAAYDRLRRDDPEGWQDYLDELAGWDVVGGESDDAATQEWPEFNQ